MDPDISTAGAAQARDPVEVVDQEGAGRPPVRSRSTLYTTGVGQVLQVSTRTVCASVAGAIVLTVVLATGYVHHLTSEPSLLAVWWIGNATLASWVYAFVKQSRVGRRQMEGGRVVAIVRSYEQDAADLHACVWSILNQRDVVVEEVHVVDDGSTRRPVQPFAHPRVRWHRTNNSGGHAAVGYVLDRLQPGDWDFVLIVDGDCTLEERSMAHQLVAFSEPDVTATTGILSVRHSRRNLFTRVADLSIGTSSAVQAAEYSRLRTVMPVVGAPVLYRARIPFQYRHRLFAAGGSHDNRRLALHAGLEGHVVGVSKAVARISPAADVPSAYRRQLRWSTSWWRMIRLMVTGADPRRGVLTRLVGLVHLIVIPSAIGFVLVSIMVNGWPTFAFLAAAYFLVLRYAATALYLLDRPATSRRGKLWTWLLLTPVEATCYLLFVIPVRYIALIRIGMGARRKWADRGGLSSTGPAASPGVIYYSGYLPDGSGS